LFSLRWKSLLETVQSFHRPQTWGRISPLLYLRFWSLSLSDIYVPRARYLSEIEKVQKAVKEAQNMVGWEQKKRDREAKILKVRRQ
jgi:THO complex subunit 2